MQGQVLLQPAFLLHSRPYRDTSLLVDFLTRDHGRIRAVAKGMRGPRSRQRGMLQAFLPLQISYQGRNDLKTLRQVEAHQQGWQFVGRHLFSGLYMNELLMRLVQGHEAEASLFECYRSSLGQLAAVDDVEPVLRAFELRLLELLGYGIDLEGDCDSGEPLAELGFYHYQPGTGFSALLSPSREQEAQPGVYQGALLLAIARRDFSSQRVRQAAKRLARQTLALYLGNKPLQSRALFQQGLPPRG